MPTFQDEHGSIARAIIYKEPNFSTSSKWFTVTKFIDGNPVVFYFTKANGTYFYFQYNGVWYRMMKGSILYEVTETRYIIINP